MASNISEHYEEPQVEEKQNKQDNEYCRKLQEEWLKHNKPTQCPDSYLDNPYKQTERQGSVNF